MTLSRRDFLKTAGAAGIGAAVLPAWWPEWIDPAYAAPRDLTTLGRTIVKGSALNEGSSGFTYYRLAEGPGEPHIMRGEIATRKKRGGARRSLLNFVHFTDIHIVDAESPARVEFLDRYDDKQCSDAPFVSAYRPQEAMTVQVLEAMVRQVRAVRRSPVTGRRMQFSVCTGDNIDNEQFNELRWFIDTMDGAQLVTPNSGDPMKYEGVMAPDWGDDEYWHPDEGIVDKYKAQYGFPEYPGLLEAAIKPFRAAGVGMPWFQTFGNHDGLMQGNAPRNDAFERAAVGGTKVSGPPPGANPCDELSTLLNDPSAFTAAPAHQVTADENRHIITREAYIAEMFKTTGAPNGHGFTDANMPQDDGTIDCYWHTDKYKQFRLIGLDTVNPGGLESGSIGDRQFKWLEEKMIEVSARYFDADGKEVTTNNKNRYIILCSHHGLRSLDNEASDSEDPQQEGINDQPRHLADEVAALVHRFPNVIAWVNGHTHNNVVEPRKDPAAKTQGFWDIGTAAHIDWTCQTRLIDVVDNGDGTLSIFCTMIDHAAPPVPSPTKNPVLYLASVSRELAANDYHYGFESKGPGKIEDRNVELVIKAPFKPPRRTKTSRRELVSPLSH